MSQFLGSWEIIDSGLWGADDLDLVGPPEIVFEDDGLGSLRIGALEAELDYRVNQDHDQMVAEFSWCGFDDLEPVSGRGSALVVSGELRGKLFIHLGDESEFTAVPKVARRGG